MKKNTFLICFLLAFTSLRAQTEDAQIWTSVSFEKKIGPLFSVYLSPEIRFIENVSQVGNVFADAGLSYKITKVVKLSAAYRISNKRTRSNGFEIRNRFITELDLRFKMKPVILINRLRYQSQYDESYFPEQNDKLPQNYLRERVMLKFDLDRRISPYISGEVFYRLDHPLEISAYNFDNVRVAAGFNYEINQALTIGLSYLIQQEFNIAAPSRDYVGGVDLKFTF